MSLKPDEIKRLGRIAFAPGAEHWAYQPGQRRPQSVEARKLLAMDALTAASCQLCHRGAPTHARNVFGSYRGLCASCIAELDGKPAARIERRSSFSPQQQRELAAMTQQRRIRAKAEALRRQMGLPPITARPKLHAEIRRAYGGRSRKKAWQDVDSADG
ncbi:MAG: hypothetical protein ACLQIB_13675 [Isosphaeraceae bacterium]